MFLGTLEMVNSERALGEQARPSSLSGAYLPKSLVLIWTEATQTSRPKSLKGSLGKKPCDLSQCRQEHLSNRLDR